MQTLQFNHHFTLALLEAPSLNLQSELGGIVMHNYRHKNNTKKYNIQMFLLSIYEVDDLCKSK